MNFDHFKMHLYRHILMRLPGIAACVVMLGLLPAHAQDKAAAPEGISPSVIELKRRYPAGTINSNEMASEALDDVKEERANIEARLKNDQRECTKKFLVTKCRDEAKAQRRKDREQLKLIENEAARYKRQQKVIERDEELARKREKEEEDANKRAKSQERHVEKEAQRAERGGVGPGLSGNPPLTAEERAANVEAYEKKLEEVEENKRKVAERKAKNESKRAKKRAAEAKEKEKAAKATAKAEAEK